MTDMVMENLHRHLYRFMIVDLLLGIFIVSPLLILLPYYLSLILVIPIFGVITFKNKRKYGDLWGISLLLILSLIFALVGIQDLSRGDNSDTIQGILLLLLSISTIRRIKTIRNPTYKNWYNNMKENIDVLNSQLEENEVFATCPSCSTLLAVIPSKLSEEDKCPNCNGNLVN
ncbi:hypothetical protein OAH71_01405 [Euryarchaeota archaeon]|jgi:hypothetical protein|nr:hypothetical protein [Euryarchaeota archaeon]MDG1542530.1 hypothetical protein [Candidatus Thalassarchaeaceae archaeon]|tara:strand:- start:132 stop:650 length:519 start_codon:yes stop_codon:yes gene_type:complete